MPLAQLPPSPKKRRRYFVKTTVAPPAEVDKQTISGNEPQPKTPPGNPIDEPQPTTQPGNSTIDEEMQPGYEPQQISLHSENIPQEAREAFDDMVELFLTQRKCVSVDVCYTLLRENTRTYLRSLKQQRPQ